MAITALWFAASNPCSMTNQESNLPRSGYIPTLSVCILVWLVQQNPFPPYQLWYTAYTPTFPLRARSLARDRPYEDIFFPIQPIIFPYWLGADTTLTSPILNRLQNGHVRRGFQPLTSWWFLHSTCLIRHSSLAKTTPLLLRFHLPIWIFCTYALSE